LKQRIKNGKEKLNKGDVVLLEGYLQTKKIKVTSEEMNNEGEKKFIRVSCIICQAFTFLDKDTVSVFSPLDKLTRIVKEVRKIDWEEEIESAEE